MISNQNLEWDFPTLALALNRTITEIDPSTLESLSKEVDEKHVRWPVMLKRLDKKYKWGLCLFLHRWLHVRIKFVSPHPWLGQFKKDDPEVRKRMQQLNAIMFKYLHKASIMSVNPLLNASKFKNDFETMRPLLSAHLIKLKELVNKGGPANLQQLTYLAATELELKRQRWTNAHWRAIRDLESVCDLKILSWVFKNEPENAKLYAMLINAFETADKLSAREALGHYDGISRKHVLGRSRKLWHDYKKTPLTWRKAVEKGKQSAKNLS